jgi:hypothetical protein
MHHYEENRISPTNFSLQFAAIISRDVGAEALLAETRNIASQLCDGLGIKKYVLFRAVFWIVLP